LPFSDELETEVPNYEHEQRKYDTHLMNLKTEIEQAIDENAIEKFSGLKQRALK
jgi:hypothetical protein